MDILEVMDTFAGVLLIVHGLAIIASIGSVVVGYLPPVEAFFGYIMIVLLLSAISFPLSIVYATIERNRILSRAPDRFS
jgi:hypothetical protein